MERIRPYLEALTKVSNLNENQAKTLIYYCIMTWSDEPKIRPLIDLHGESGTGKNNIMHQLMPWCRGRKWINASNKTPAQLRDDLADVTTAFIEEADKTADPKRCESWYQCRYEDTGKGITYKKQKETKKGYIASPEETHNHFGYTIMHTQNAFERIELDRRIITISLTKDMTKKYAPTEGLTPEYIIKINSEVDWDAEIPQTASNSAWDAWLPLMKVATYLKDEQFLKYATEQVARKSEEDELTKVFEPKGVILSEIAPLYRACLTGDAKRIPITDIRAAVQIRGYFFNEKQITKTAKELGFNVVYPHNKAYIKVECEAQLEAIMEKAGISEKLRDGDKIEVPLVESSAHVS